MKSFLFFIELVYFKIPQEEENSLSFFKTCHNQKIFCFLLDSEFSAFIPYIFDLKHSIGNNGSEDKLNFSMVRSNYKALIKSKKETALKLIINLNDESIYNLNPILILFGFVNWSLFDRDSKAKFFEPTSFCQLKFYKKSHNLYHLGTKTSLEIDIIWNKIYISLDNYQKYPEVEILHYYDVNTSEKSFCVPLKQENWDSSEEYPYKKFKPDFHHREITFSENLDKRLFEIRETIKNLRECNQIKCNRGELNVYSSITTENNENINNINYNYFLNSKREIGIFLAVLVFSILIFIFIGKYFLLNSKNSFKKDVFLE